MFFKLMIRGLWRHQKRGRRLFVLLALCCMALIALLTFEQDFGSQYRDEFIGTKTGHLQVLPVDSPVFAETSLGAQSQEVPLLRISAAFDSWVRSQPEVEEAAPVITRYGVAYNLDSEYDSWMSLVAVPADRRDKLFPMAKVLEGSPNLAWTPSDAEVPVLHARLQSEFGQKNPDSNHFVKQDLKSHTPADLEEFKHRLKTDFPTLFGEADLRGETGTGKFLELWSAGLTDPDLPKKIPAARLEKYDYRIDDAVAAITENADPARLTFLNKRLFQALYPDAIWEVREPLVPGKSITLQIPALKNEGALTMPKLLPGKYAGMVDIMPLYTPDSFLDLTAFRHYLDVPDEMATAYVIRLQSMDLTAAFQKKLEAWLALHGAENDLTQARVVDALFLGKLFMATAQAFDVIIGILIGVFALIVVIFIINLVLMSLLQRRREIGTGIAMGLTGGQTVGIMLGEVAVIVTVSWVAGALLGWLAVAAGAAWGVPGMIFFPGQRLFLTHQLLPYGLSYCILLPTSLAAAWLPLSGLQKLLPVDFFREAR